MKNAWRKAINAVLSTFLIAGMTTLPSVLGDAAYAQSEGDTRTVQQEAGTRTDTAADTSASYDPGTGVTTIRRRQDTVRLYGERKETYRQTGNRTETRYRQEPVYETRYRKEQRQRQEEQQVARTGYRQETQLETRYRNVYETKTRQVARTGYRSETRYRTDYDPIYRTEAYQDQEPYTAYGWRWETRYNYSWQWVTRYRNETVLRWYTSPGYYDYYWVSDFIYPGCYWGRVQRSRYVAGYRYAAWETVAVPYQSCELVASPVQECVSYAYTAYRSVTKYRSVFWYWKPVSVAYTVSVPYTYYETESYQEQVFDITGYRDNYGYTWVTETYRNNELIYPGCYYGYVTRSRQVWKYAYIGREAILTPRQEAYQVPVTKTVAYTYYEPVTVTVTYYVDVAYEVQTGTKTVSYQVVVPVYNWVPNGDWQAKEEVTRTSFLTVGRVGSALMAAEAVNPAKAKSSSFLSDNGTGNTKTELAGSKKRLAFKADEAIASTAKRVEVVGGSIREVSLPNASSTVNRNDDKDKKDEKENKDKKDKKDDKDDKDKGPGQPGASAAALNVSVSAVVATPAPIASARPAATPAPVATPATAATTVPPAPAATAAPAASTSGFAVNDWVGTWTQGNYTVIFERDGNGIDYEFRVRNGSSWENILGGSLSNGNATFTDSIGGDIGTGASLTLSRVGGSSALRIAGYIRCNGTRYNLDNLRK